MNTFAQMDPAAAAYDRMAPYYDAFTAGYAHDSWVEAIECRAIELGLRGRRALDLACGTGKSTMPLIARGYSVLACDISEGMVRQARRKLPDHAAAFRVADMRSLPALGQFDLVLCLDDALNYLLSEDDLDATFASVARLLAPHGVFVFDLNTLATYRSAFAGPMIREDEGVFFTWTGEGTSAFEPGQATAATVDVFAEREDGLWERSSSRHVQRHHGFELVRDRLDHAGLDCRLVAGQLSGGHLDACFDENRHIKLVYFTQRTQLPFVTRRPR